LTPLISIDSVVKITMCTPSSTPNFSRPANQRPSHDLQSGISKLANCNSNIIPGFNVTILLDLKSIKFVWKYPAEA
jgi:hypothetical protein